MRIAIYGAGSLGTILGAYLTRAGTQVDLINRNKAHVEALQQKGATITGTVSFNQRVTALLPDDMQGTYDLIFLMTKQQQNPEVVAFLKPYLGDKGTLCTLQNGLPEPEIAALLGEERVMGCVVEWGATMVAPGVCELTSEPDSLSFELGRLTGGVDDRVMQVKQVLEGMCPVTVEENFIGVRWSKLLINAAFSGVSTVMGSTFGEAAKDKRSRRCIQSVIKECIDVTRAGGIQIAPVQGKDIAKLLDYKGAFKRWISFMIIPIAIKKHAGLKASMLQDLEHGKRTEVDFIDGVVSEYGRKYGVPTPFSDRVVKVIHGIEEGAYKPAFKNVDLFKDLLG